MFELDAFIEFHVLLIDSILCMLPHKKFGLYFVLGLLNYVRSARLRTDGEQIRHGDQCKMQPLSLSGNFDHDRTISLFIAKLIGSNADVYYNSELAVYW